MSKASLRSALNAGQFLAVPGIHDMIAASVANKIGLASTSSTPPATG